MRVTYWFKRIVPLALLTTLILMPLASTDAQSSTERLESDDHRVTQTGAWQLTEDESASGGSYLLNSGNPDDTLALDFSGTYLEIIYVGGPWTGTLVIEIDGVERRTVATSGDLTFNQSVVFQYLADEAHTLRVYGVEGDLIAIDAFVTVPRAADSEEDTLAPDATAAPDDSPYIGPGMGTPPEFEAMADTPPDTPQSAQDADDPLELESAPSGAFSLSFVKLTATDGAAFDRFGFDVGISGQRVIVGAPYDDPLGSNSGAAYIYERQPWGSWTQTKLTASDGAAGDSFGWDVAMSGDYAVVAAPFNDDNGSNSGSVYIYERQPNGVWQLAYKRVAVGAAAGDQYGIRVEIDGNYIVVGANSDDDRGSDSGSAFLYERLPDGFWAYEAKLVPSDGAAGDRFGWDVGISGERVIVGAPFDDFLFTNSGSAYIFKRQSDGNWPQEVKLTASDAFTEDNFGYSVAIDSFRAIVGSPFDNPKGVDSGSAYVFVRQGNGTWAQTKLTPSDGATDDNYGIGVGIEGRRVIVGALNDDPRGTNSGSAYIWDLSPGGVWSQSKFFPVGTGAGDQFGYGSIDGGRAIFGASNDDDAATDAGAAYVYDLAPVPDENLLENGDFSQGRPPWSLFGDYVFRVQSGVMEFYRTFPGWQTAQLFQNVDRPIPAFAPMEVKVDLGNSSNVSKGVRLRLRNQAWTDVITCAVTIPPNTPLTTVTMQGITSQVWDDFNLTVALFDNDNLGYVRVDNAAVTYRPSAGISGFNCFGLPTPANTNLLKNPDFSNGRFYWTLWGDFAFSVNSGVMQFYRVFGATRLANLFTEAPTVIPANAPIRLNISIGNSSILTKTVSVILRDSLWAQTFNCTFIVPPNTPLTSVRVQGLTSEVWTNPLVMVRALDADGSAAVLVDNATVRYLPGTPVTQECTGPFTLTN